MSQQTVRQFIKTQKEDKETEKNQEKTKNKENNYQMINNKKNAQQTEESLEINPQQTEEKKSTTSFLPNINTKLPDDFVNPLKKVMENYKKEQAENPRHDSLNFNLDKIYTSALI